MKIVAAAVLALSLLFGGCASVPAPTEHDIPPIVTQWAQDNIWQVATDWGSGSGFFIDNDTFITACHVVVMASVDDLIIIRTKRDTRIIEVKTRFCDEDSDVAVLDLVKHKHADVFATDSTPLAQGTPRQGKVVYGAGYPLGMPLTITLGHVQLELPEGPKQVSWIVTTNTIMGDSGSPVIGIVDGKVQVVGMRVAIRGIPQIARFGFGGFNSYLPHLTLMVPAYKIKEVLDEQILQQTE